MFSLNFTTDNAAFDDGAATETARILRWTADRVEDAHLSGHVSDHNGNTVGSYTLNGDSAPRPLPGEPGSLAILPPIYGPARVYRATVESRRNGAIGSFEALSVEVEAESPADASARALRIVTFMGREAVAVTAVTII